jgi:DNA topoisomerase III
MIPFWKKTDKGGKKKPPKPAVPRTAQQSIPMQRMFEDGTCRVKPNYYTRTIQYQDINYQLAQQEDKTAIFEEWCSFLNFFDSSIKFELSFVNMATDSTEFEKSIRIPFQKDGFDDVRAEYSQMLRQQLAKGNNGLTKTKFITFGVEGESMAQVKPRLDHIQNDLLNNFHRLGVQAKPLNGAQRLKLMHDMFNMDGASKFHFDWKDLVKSGLSVKDAIAPTAFAFKNSRTFQMGGIFCAANFLSITASDISDQLLKDFLDMDSSQIVTMHIQSVDQNRAIKTVKRTITELDRSKIEEQKKAIRAGYDIDIIPSDLATYGRDAKALLKELQSQNERMFLVTFLVLNTGRTEQELENNVFQASSIAQKHNCNLCRLDFQQEHGLMSSLPLADCQIEIQRGLTTSSTAIFIPFTTQELYQSGKESLYYGLNALSNNLIMVDRKKLKNPNGLILGTPGSGKSFSAKREIANAFLVTDDDIIINDPEGEYSPLVNRLKGQVIKISPNSTQFVNPMDINANYSEEDNPLSLKADFILSLCELVVGGKEGLLPVEKTVIDRCVHLIYRKYFANPCPENMPILEDLYNALLQQDEKEAHHVATALEIYVKGSLNLFNHRTNVNVNNRIVCYDIKELGKQMKKLGILKDLMNRPDVDSIVNSCDSGREGELIFRLVYQQAGCKKPFSRLWLSSMEETAIREGFQKLKPSTEYDALYNAALCRERADWMVGINASRLFSCLYGQPLAVGRVMTPVLAMTVVREAAIAAFVPEKFYTVDLELTSGCTASSKRFAQKEDAELLLSKCRKEGRATVQKMERKEKSESPPQLYDLTALQRDANRLLGFTAQQTLDYAQSLYEKRLITYPRTDSRFLTEDMAASLPGLVTDTGRAFAVEEPFPIHVQQVINGSKVTDHHALLPTKSMANADLAALPAGERNVLRLIAARLLCAVVEPYCYAETTLTTICAGEEFTAKGKVVLSEGWKAVERKMLGELLGKQKEPAVLPDVQEQSRCSVSGAELKEGQTSPSKHFTEDLLLHAMETASADSMPEGVERQGIGTPATRAATIEKLVQKGFLERKGTKKNKVLLSTDKGKALITVMPEEIQSPEMTADWETKLLQIERGEMEPGEFMTEINTMITELVKNTEMKKGANALMKSKIIGVCPNCGKPVVEREKGWFCENRECRFVLWKDNAFFNRLGKRLDSHAADKLLRDGRVRLKDCKSVKGKTYNATVLLGTETDGRSKFSLEFEGGC